MLEKLALISSDTGEQTKWQQLVEEAKENLCKIQVCFPSSDGVFRSMCCTALLSCLCLACLKQDDDFVVNFCLKAQWITYETTQEMLSYAKARVGDFPFGKFCFNCV